MYEHEAGVDQIESGVGQRVGDDVVLDDLQVGRSVSGNPTDVQVGSQHPAGCADLFGHPPSYRSAAGADLQAVPAGADAPGGQVGASQFVVAVLEPEEAARGLGCRIVEEVGQPLTADRHLVAHSPSSASLPTM